MGLGYHQARAAGLGAIRESRSPRQVNIQIRTAQAARELRKKVEEDREWGPFVKHFIEEVTTRNVS